MTEEKKARVRKPRTPSGRYGIAEWYGRDMRKLTPEERQVFGRVAAKQDALGEVIVPDAPDCPFLQSLIPSAKCSKAGGVCSIRKYAFDGSTKDEDYVVTTCPVRFLQPVKNHKSIFTWISQKMLDTEKPTIVKETPFLRKISNTDRPTESAEEMKAEAKEEKKKAGRIDWIIVDPETISSGEMAWCAIETQALYFSGKGMPSEFRAYANAPNAFLFANTTRRPDYRSSGPKRLWPQLDVKVPALRSWGKKVVVVIDRFFYSNMNKLVDSSPRARDDKERRENADVAWFIVDYDDQLQLVAADVIFTSLENSRTALNATQPLSKSDFTAELKKVIADGRKTNKVFRT